jgi:hypothetical protein
LILPILYIPVPGLLEDAPEDPLMAAVKTSQWKPWVPLRFKERESGEYRAAVNELAEEIARRVDAVEAADVPAAALQAEAALADDGEPGLIDRVAALEEATPRWVETLQAIGAQVAEIGEVMRRGTDEINRSETQGKGFAARLTIARRVATELDGPVSQIESLTKSWVADLDAIDLGIRALLSAADVPENTEIVDNFMDQLRFLSQAANQGLGATAGLVHAVEQVSGMSRDMRPVLRRLRSSLTAMTEARAITDEWMTLADDSRRQGGGAP